MAEPLPAKPRVATLWLPDIQDWGLAGYDPRRGAWVLIEGAAVGDLGPDRVADLVEARWDDGPATEEAGDGIDPTIAAGYRLEDIRDYSPRDLGFGADGHSDEQTGGEH